MHLWTSSEVKRVKVKKAVSDIEETITNIVDFIMIK